MITGPFGKPRVVSAKIERRPATWTGSIVIGFVGAIIATVLDVWIHPGWPAQWFMVPILVWFGLGCRAYGLWEGKWKR